MSELSTSSVAGPAVLVTGGAGFIGCALAPHLLRLGLPVVAVDSLLEQVHPGGARPAALPGDVELVVGDVADPAVWDDVLARHRPQLVVHLAAETGTAQSLTESTRHAMTNVVGTTAMLDAFVRHDEALAHDVLRRDAQVDRVYRAAQDALVARMQEHPDAIPAQLDRLWCARSFERIGDRCKNLCEFVLYLVRGKDVRHTGLAKAGSAY